MKHESRGWSKVALGLSLLLLVQPAPSSARTESFEWTAGAPSTASLRVEIRKGDISVKPAADDRIRVVAVKQGSDRDISRVTIDARRDGAEVEIRANYPPRKHRDEPETRVRIDVDVFLPAGVSFIGETGIGDVTAVGVTDPLEAYTDIGDIRIRTESYAQGRTINGDIHAVLGRTDWPGKVAFETTNGHIDVRLPETPDTAISATSINGRFETNLFPVERKRHGIPGSRISGVLGNAGRRLELKTVNGDIELRRRTD